MPSVDSFPRELLAQPTDARLAYFTSKVVAHPRLTAVHRAVRDALSQPAGASLKNVTHGRPRFRPVREQTNSTSSCV